MNQLDKPEFERNMRSMLGVFNISEMRLENLIDPYFMHLEDVPLHRVVKAVHLAIRTLDTFPSINRLRTLAGAHDEPDDCEKCKPPTERHIVDLTQQLYDRHNRDIPWVLELVYSHAKTTYNRNPKIMHWAQKAIADMERWPTVPKRLQTLAEKEIILKDILSRRYPADEMLRVTRHFIG